MISNIWRYSHFFLAISSSVFVLLATVTGIILGLEPIENKLEPVNIPHAQEQVLADVVQLLELEYEEILDLEVNQNGGVKLSTIDMDPNKDGNFYINPFTGKKIANIPDKKPFYEWTANFHRSLFLKTPGRIFVGIISFLLLLIAITGLLLVVKRQKGIKGFFKKIIKEDFFQFYHIFLGRWMLIPIVIITLTGVYLSVFRFSSLSSIKPTEIVFNHPKNQENIPLVEFDIFKQTKLKDIQKLTFPFSDDEEETFVLLLHNKEVYINQKTGELVSEKQFPFAQALNSMSFNLHTGTGSIWWSVVLIIACINILFFMYSGFVISYKRIRSKIKNKYQAYEAEIVLLVGSENGSTNQFAAVLKNSLLFANKKVFVGNLNQYQVYPNLTHLIILTSTYGDGEPPANANKFLSLLNKTKQKQSFQYAVVGFGSKVYPKFCQYALDIEKQLATKNYCSPITDIALINNKSYDSFKQWAVQFGKATNIKIEQLPNNLKNKPKKQYRFKIIDKKTVRDNFDETFVLTLKPFTKRMFSSGDLLGIYPPQNANIRLYSIGKTVKGHILLSIKKHEYGVCSNYLKNLEVGNSFKAELTTNKAFHVPAKATSLMLVGNGTGMAPFLGMVNKAKQIPVHVFWGGRTVASYQLYHDFLQKQQAVYQNLTIKTAFSQEKTEKQYVQDLLKKQDVELANQLEMGGVMMICGSIAMQQEVLKLMEHIVKQHTNSTLQDFIDQKQILMDCY